MPRTVFWSWQSDLPARETRDIIRDALVDALARVSADMEEAARPEIDHDTRGVPGSPEIVATILAKIDKAAVFVGDVTPIAMGDGGKHLPNPNVLIELGYAKKALTSDRMVLVWNTAITDARPEDLPFDLRHRRGPISYSLAPGASRAELKEARRHLTDRLEEHLLASLAVYQPDTGQEPNWQPVSDEDQSIWASGTAPLVVRTSFNSVRISMASRPRAYARLVPSTWSAKPEAQSIFQDGVQNPIPLGRFSGLDWGPTQGGFLAYRSNASIENGGVTQTATRWFRGTGEFWGVASSFFVEHRDSVTFSDGYAYDQWVLWFEHHCRLCREVGGAGPFFAKMGLVGLGGTYWPRTNFPHQGHVEALENELHHSFVLAAGDEGEIKDVVNQFMDEVRVAFGFRPILA